MKCFFVVLLCSASFLSAECQSNLVSPSYLKVVDRQIAANKSKQQATTWWNNYFNQKAVKSWLVPSSTPLNSGEVYVVTPGMKVIGYSAKGLPMVQPGGSKSKPTIFSLIKREKKTTMLPPKFVY